MNSLSPINAEISGYLEASGWIKKPESKPGYVVFRKGTMKLTISLNSVLLEVWHEPTDERSEHWGELSNHTYFHSNWKLLDWSMYLHVIGAANIRENMRKANDDLYHMNDIRRALAI